MAFEIDGPPRPYFEIFDTPMPKMPGDVTMPEPRLIRVIYQTVFASRQEELDAFLRAMHEELKRVSPDADGIIWWRIRPRQEPPLTRAGAPRIRCRLETSPPLSRNWWMAHAFLVVDDPADTTQRWQVNPLP